MTALTTVGAGESRTPLALRSVSELECIGEPSTKRARAAVEDSDDATEALIRERRKTAAYEQLISRHEAELAMLHTLVQTRASGGDPIWYVRHVRQQGCTCPRFRI